MDCRAYVVVEAGCDLRVGGISLLQRILKNCRRYGITQITLAVAASDAPARKHVQKILADQEYANLALSESLVPAAPVDESLRSYARGAHDLFVFRTQALMSFDTLGEIIATIERENIRDTLTLKGQDGKVYGLYVSEAAAATRDFSLVGLGHYAIHHWVASKKDRPAAHETLRRTLIKPSDGPVDKYFNRHISTHMSVPLAQWNISPNLLTTISFLMSLWAAWVLSTGEYMWIAIAGITFQLAGIVDCNDGEVARMAMKQSDFGTWYDTITDNIRYGAFFVGLAAASLRIHESSIYIWGSGLFVILLGYLVAMMVNYERKNHLSGTHIVVIEAVERKCRDNPDWWDRHVVPLRAIVKQDSTAVLMMLLCVMGRPEVMFWLGVFGLLCMTLTVQRALREPEPANILVEPEEQLIEESARSPLSFILFILIGAGVLASLFYFIPTQDVVTQIKRIGWSMAWIFPIAPLWFITTAFSIRTLTGKRIPILPLLYNQLTGDALNNLVPLAGVAGEPYRIKHFSKWMSLEEASVAVVHDKLVHITAALSFSGLSIFLALALLPQNAGFFGVALLTAFAFILGATVTGIFAVSPAPSAALNFILKRFKFFQQNGAHKLSTQRFLGTYFWKFVGNALTWIELWAIFHLLGLPASFAHVVAVSALIASTSAVFFVVPQGLGVNEAGITTVFSLLGLPFGTGLVIGLVRRARILFWSFFGLILLTSNFMRKKILIKTSA